MPEKYELCYRDDGTHQAFYYTDRYCAQYGDDIKCIPSNGEVAVCIPDKDDKMWSCYPFDREMGSIETDSEVKGKCIRSGKAEPTFIDLDELENWSSS